MDHLKLFSAFDDVVAELIFAFLFKQTQNSILFMTKFLLCNYAFYYTHKISPLLPIKVNNFKKVTFNFIQYF